MESVVVVLEDTFGMITKEGNWQPIKIYYFDRASADVDFIRENGYFHQGLGRFRLFTIGKNEEDKLCLGISKDSAGVLLDSCFPNQWAEPIYYFIPITKIFG